MWKYRFRYYFIFISVAILTVLFGNFNGHSTKLVESQPSDKTVSAFNTMMQVITHQRCINCHPSGDTPLQGEDSHLHHFGIERGKDNQGLVAYNCSTCHGNENYSYSGVPGAPHWALAPAQFAWEGKSDIEIAQQMIDPKRNGGRSHEAILHHLTEDELVLWAWNPGVNAEGEEREKPPVSKEDYIAAVKEWIENGAIIPQY